MPNFTGIFALLVAAAGWFYLFYSRAAERLAGVEETAINVKRVRLRRVGGFVLIALAMLLYVGGAVVDWDRPTIWFLVTWVAIMLLLAVVTGLALIDLRLTTQLRQHRNRERRS